MKKTLLSIFLLLSSLFLIQSKEVELIDAGTALHEYLLKKYGEEFTIRHMYRRSFGENRDFYQGTIFPKRFQDTPFEDDEYYHNLGNVGLKKDKNGNERIDHVGDTYGIVAVNISGNDFLQPKIEELFGKKSLILMELEPGYVHNNGKFWDTVKVNRERGDGNGPRITFKVFVWGRVDNLQQKETYRKKLYELIQYLKSHDLFRRTNMGFYILDERCLPPSFDKTVGDQLRKARNEKKTSKEFIAYRNKLMKTLDNEYNKMSESAKLLKINSYNRTDLLDIIGTKAKRNRFNKYSAIYHKGINSIGQLESSSLYSDYKRVKYDALTDVKLYNTIKVDYKEYNEKDMKNNTWDGE